ncbi:MAG: glycosyltransferase [Pseudomonadota bacterium]
MSARKTVHHTEKLKVAILTTSFPIARGMTSGIFIQKLVNYLPSKIDVSVIAPASVDLTDKFQEKKYQLHFIRYGPRRWQKLAHQPGGILVALKQQKMMYFLLPVFISSMFIQCVRISRHRDLIHANWSINGLVAGLAGLITRKPVITTLRGSDINNIRTSIIFNFILKFCLALSSKVITVSDAFLKKLSCEYPAYRKKLFMIPNGVDPELLQFPLEKQKKICQLLTIGNIVPNKGMTLIVDALYSISDNNISLNIVGDGVEKEKLKGDVVRYGLCSTIKFIGFLPPQKIYEKLRYADILILSSYKEGRPNVVLEAMAAGVPVIASDIEGVRELIKNNVNGLLFEPGNSRELSRRICQLRNDFDLRLRLARTAREFIIENNLLWSNTGQLYADLYQELI